MFSFMDLKFIVVFIWLIFGHIKGNISLKNKNQHDNLEMRITLMINNSVKWYYSKLTGTDEIEQLIYVFINCYSLYDQGRMYSYY